MEAVKEIPRKGRKAKNKKSRKAVEENATPESATPTVTSSDSLAEADVLQVEQRKPESKESADFASPSISEVAVHGGPTTEADIPASETATTSSAHHIDESGLTGTNSQDDASISDRGHQAASQEPTDSEPISVSPHVEARVVEHKDNSHLVNSQSDSVQDDPPGTGVVLVENTASETQNGVTMECRAEKSEEIMHHSKLPNILSAAESPKEVDVERREITCPNLSEQDHNKVECETVITDFEAKVSDTNFDAESSNVTVNEEERSFLPLEAEKVKEGDSAPPELMAYGSLSSERTASEINVGSGLAFSLTPQAAAAKVAPTPLPSSSIYSEHQTDRWEPTTAASSAYIPQIKPFVTQFTTCAPLSNAHKYRTKVETNEKIPLKVPWKELEDHFNLTLDDSDDEAWTTIEYYKMILKEDMLPERKKMAANKADSVNTRTTSENDSTLSVKISDSMKNLYSGTSLLHRSENAHHKSKCCHHHATHGCHHCHHVSACDYSLQLSTQEFYPCANPYDVCHRHHKYKKKGHLQLQPYSGLPNNNVPSGPTKREGTWFSRTKSMFSRAKNALRSSFQLKSPKKNLNEPTAKDLGSNNAENGPEQQETLARPVISEQVEQIVSNSENYSVTLSEGSPSGHLLFS